MTERLLDGVLDSVLDAISLIFFSRRCMSCTLSQTSLASGSLTVGELHEAR